ncbi:hypothetical protein [Microbacterium sp. 22242]|uniref:hypothetical protein n=1 Tax=Microbacterium sp. 22242 TaxID=3453896 RepID=UPI003F84BAA8
MPRLTNRDYLTHRHFLIELWNEMEGAVFAELPGWAQHDLHDFYAPSEFMWDDDALAHRAAITKAFPALPQKAGRAYEALKAYREGRSNSMLTTDRQAATGTSPVGNSKTKTHSIRVSAVSRPQIDLHYLAKALLQLARDDLAKQHPEVHLDKDIPIDIDEDLSR